MSETVPLTSSTQPSREDEADEICRHVSLIGGPLHRAARRLGFVPEESNTVLTGVVIGVSLWLALVATAVVFGAAGRLFTVPAVVIHVRLLVVIPLLFACESLFQPRVRGFFAALLDSGVLPRSESPAFAASVARLHRRKDSWLGDVVCLAIAAAMSFDLPIAAIGHRLALPSAATVVRDAVPVSVMLLAGVTVFRFLLVRWAWRLVLWTLLLWNLSRCRLRLVATHPDRVGGLGGLEGVQLQLVPLVAAVSAALAAATAAELAIGTIAFVSIYPLAMLALSVSALLLVMPLLPFLPVLFVCRRDGLSRYMSFATRLVVAFEEKWISPRARLDNLLGTADLRSLADLDHSMSVVREMRFTPMGPRLILGVVLGSVLPQLPLLLFKYSLPDLAQKFLTRLLG